MAEDFTDATAGLIEAVPDKNDFQPRDVPLSGRSEGPVTADGGGALDDLFKKSTTPPEKKEPEEGDDDPEQKDEPAEKKELAKKDEPLPEKKDEPAKKADEPEQKDETAAEKKPDEPKDALAEVTLPPHAKPATVKSFDEVKRRAREEISTLQTKIKDLETKVPKAGSKLPNEVEAELKELRAFRTAHDYQNDPEFKTKFVTPIEENNDVISKKLKDSGFSDEQISAAKQIGFDKLDWEPVLAKLPSLARRSVEALLLRNEQIGTDKDKALAAAKDNPKNWQEAQTKAQTEKSVAEETTVKSTVDAFIAQQDWMKPKAIPAGASVEQRKQIEADNAAVKTHNDRLKVLLADNSPEMRGTMIASTLLAYQFKGLVETYKTRAETAEAELGRVKKATNTSKANKSAPTSDSIPKPKTSQFESGESALDRFHKEVTNRQ